jgi:hypothetical protein
MQGEKDTEGCRKYSKREYKLKNKWQRERDFSLEREKEQRFVRRLPPKASLPTS